MLNPYRHLNAPEACMYLSRQLYEEARPRVGGSEPHLFGTRTVGSFAALAP